MLGVLTWVVLLLCRSLWLSSYFPVAFVCLGREFGFGGSCLAGFPSVDLACLRLVGC